MAVRRAFIARGATRHVWRVLAADGRMLEDHAVLSELGDDWGPLVRLALWTRDRRPYRTRKWCTGCMRLHPWLQRVVW